ncbi:MAG: hypothetical protein ACQEVA_12875 [Myxococcota bacterium]
MFGRPDIGKNLIAASGFIAAASLLAVGCGDLGSNVDCDELVEYGANAVANGDAEADPGTDGETTSVSCWTRDDGCFTVMDYELGYGGFQNVKPPNGGMNLFSGGSNCDAGNGTSVGTQTIDASLEPILGDIQDGMVTYVFSADLGGWEDQGDAATVSATFLDASGAELAVSTLGPITSEDRNGETAFLERSDTGAVPTGTESIEIRFEGNKTGGSNNDAVADNIQLVFGAE